MVVSIKVIWTFKDDQFVCFRYPRWSPWRQTLNSLNQTSISYVSWTATSMEASGQNGYWEMLKSFSSNILNDHQCDHFETIQIIPISELNARLYCWRHRQIDATWKFIVAMIASLQYPRWPEWQQRHFVLNLIIYWTETWLDAPWYYINFKLLK